MLSYHSQQNNLLSRNNKSSTAGKLVGKNVQLNFGENINSGMLQKLYWIYIFWNLQPIRYTLK